MIYDENVINLTRVYPWMTFEEAWLLMKWSYEKNMSEAKNFNALKTLMGIDFGMFQWKGEEYVRKKLELAKKKFKYNG